MTLPHYNPGVPERTCSISALVLLAAAAAAEPTAPAAATRFVGSAFGDAAEVEVLELDAVATEAAVRAAFVAIAAAEAESRGLAERAATAAGAPLALAPDELALLARAQSFCVWSEGTVTALGGEIYRLWGRRGPAPGRPGADPLATAAGRAGCARLTLDATAPSARVAAGSELDLFPFEAGWAVDRAVAALTALGVGNARVRVGPALRAIGAGPAGRGWPVTFPPLPGAAGPPPPFYLRDRAAALLSIADRPLVAGGERVSPYLDLRTGRPVVGRVLVVVVTDLAVDARALAQAMFVFGPSAGQLFLGSLQPTPSVLWLLGSGESEPVLAQANWSKVPKR